MRLISFGWFRSHCKHLSETKKLKTECCDHWMFFGKKKHKKTVDPVEVQEVYNPLGPYTVTGS
jgi:hypothetical protein